MYYPQEYRYGDVDPYIRSDMIWDSNHYSYNNNENRIIKRRCSMCNAENVWLDVIKYNNDNHTITVHCPRCGSIYSIDPCNSPRGEIGTYNIQNARFSHNF